MNNYPNAANGLKKIFYSQLLAIAGVILCVIPLINIAGMIILIASVILEIIGIKEAAKDDEGYGNAFLLTIANLALTVIQLPFDSNGVVYKLIDIANDVIQVVILYLICKTTSMLLRRMNNGLLADKGDKVIKINIYCIIISFVCGILSIIPIINILAAIAMIVVLIVSIYAAVVYVIFLKQSGEYLGYVNNF